MSYRVLATVVLMIVLVASVASTVIFVRRARFEAERPEIKGPREAEEPSESRPAIEVQESTTEHYEQGRPAWRIRLANIAVEKGGRTVTAGGLKEGIIYDKKGHPAVRVTADRVTYDTISYDFDVEGKVRVVSPKGAVITTQKVHWDNDSRTLNAPGRIMLRTKDNITVTTAGLKFDTTTQTVYCPNQVRMRTGRSDAIGRNLEYKLETGWFQLRNIQMVIDIEEAKERTGRG